MSLFHDAAFAKSTIQLSQSNAMAALDAAFYEETKKSLPADVRNPMIQSIRKFLEGTAKRTRENPELKGCMKKCKEVKGRKNKGKCRRECKKLPKIEGYKKDFLSTLPAACQSTVN